MSTDEAKAKVVMRQKVNAAVRDLMSMYRSGMIVPSLLELVKTTSRGSSYQRLCTNAIIAMRNDHDVIRSRIVASVLSNENGVDLTDAFKSFYDVVRDDHVQQTAWEFEEQVKALVKTAEAALKL